jgi:hypothetical protein
MAEAEKRFAFGRREDAAQSEEKEERRQLLESLAQTRLLIHQAYTAFNSTGDSDLIESYVFEINALQARYSYLLRRIKELDGTNAAQADVELPAPWEKAELR